MVALSTFNSRQLQFLFVALLLIAAGCRTSLDPAKPSPEGTVSATIAGRVLDESGSPLQGVSVTAAGQTTQTDVNGLFTIRSAMVPASRALIIAKKAGYFDGAHAAIPSSNGTTYIELAMAQSTVAGTISAATGGTVTLNSGATIALSPGSVVTASGTPYNGAVTVSAKHLSPADPSFGSLFPGDLRAMNADSSQAQLWSFGVMIAELSGTSGELLQPAPGKPATLTMPIASSEQSLAPATLPLWYFDESLGMWHEEGSATKQGNTYVGTAQHFSFWNYDMSVPYGIIKGRILCGGTPIPGVHVNLAAYVEGGLPNMITDGAGQFSCRVVANRPDLVILQILKAENNSRYWTNTPMPISATPNATTDLGDISLDSPCPTALEGVLVGCDGTTLVPGMVVASWAGGGMSYTSTNDGNFKLVAPANYAITYAATAASGDVAQPQTYTTGAQGTLATLPKIVACNSGVSDVQADISGSYSGQILTFSPDGSRLASLAANGTDVIIFDTKTWTQVAKLSRVIATGQYYLSQAVLRFNADGTKALVYPSVAGSFDCWDITSAAKLGTFNSSSACFTSDGQNVIASNYQQSTEYTFQGTLVKTLSLPGYSPIAIGPATGGTVAFIDNLSGKSQIDLWDVANDKSVAAFPEALPQVDSSGPSSGMQISPDGKVLGLTLTTGLQFFNLQNGASISTTLTPPSDGSYGIAPDDATILADYTAGSSSTVEIVAIADGSQKHLFDPPASGGATSGVAISPDGKYAAAVYGSEIRIWKIQ